MIHLAENFLKVVAHQEIKSYTYMRKSHRKKCNRSDLLLTHKKILSDKSVINLPDFSNSF